MAIKFLHTADWQMGMKASPAGEKAGAVRRERFETAGRIAELANRKNVDFILLVGYSPDEIGLDAVGDRVQQTRWQFR